jgi:membrane associated rhomboid family serine protease
MILPIGHEDGTVRRAPWVTLGVILVCLLVQVAMASQRDVERQADESWRAAFEYAVDHPYLRVDPALVPEEATRRLEGAIPPRDVGAEQLRLDQLTAAWRADLARHPLWRGGLIPAHPSVTGWFAHMFLHAGWLHLIGNMLFLYLAGPFLEDAWGRRLFATFYVTAGLFAGGMYALLERHLDAPLIGASGAVAGVLGAFLLLRGRTNIRFLLFLGFVATFTAPAWVMLPLWFLLELLDALAGDVNAAGMGGGVAYWAHVWGFVFGLAFAAVVQRVRPVAPQALPRAPSRDPRLDEARKLLDRGLYPRAWTLLAEAAARPNPDPEALADYWGLAVHLGREAEALPAARELLRGRLRDREFVEAGALLVQLEGPLATDPELPSLQLRAADGLAAQDPEAAMRLLAAARARADLPPGLQAKAARLAERLAATAPRTVSPGAPSPAG